MSLLGAYQEPLSVAIAENATTPVPTTPGAEVWSTIAAKKLVWNGTAWVAATGSSGGGLSNVAFADFASRRFPTSVNGVPSSGAAQGQATQPAECDSVVRAYMARTSSATPLFWGGWGNTVFGSSGSVFLADLVFVSADGSQKMEMHRTMYTTTAVAGAVAGWRSTLEAFMSNGFCYGGFFFAARFGFPEIYTPAPHWFIGLMPLNAALSNAISANCIGFGQGSGGVGLICNGTSTANTQYINAATSIDSSNTGVMYDVCIYNPRKTRTVYWGFRVAGTDAMPMLLRTYTAPTASEVVNAPAANGSFGGSPVMLGPQCWVSNGGAAIQVAMEVASVYLETWV